jgi:hypothetical protein
MIAEGGLGLPAPRQRAQSIFKHSKKPEGSGLYQNTASLPSIGVGLLPDGKRKRRLAVQPHGLSNPYLLRTGVHVDAQKRRPRRDRCKLRTSRLPPRAAIQSHKSNFSMNAVQKSFYTATVVDEFPADLMLEVADTNLCRSNMLSLQDQDQAQKISMLHTKERALKLAASLADVGGTVHHTRNAAGARGITRSLAHGEDKGASRGHQVSQGSFAALGLLGPPTLGNQSCQLPAYSHRLAQREAMKQHADALKGTFARVHQPMPPLFLSGRGPVEAIEAIEAVAFTNGGLEQPVDQEDQEDQGSARHGFTPGIEASTLFSPPTVTVSKGATNQTAITLGYSGSAVQ